MYSKYGGGISESPSTISYIMDMTKCAVTCKNTADGHEQENMEEGTTLGSNMRTVRQLTG